MEQAKQKTVFGDMTSGNPAMLILKFTIPLLIGNIFQQLYNMVDSIVVGNYVGHIALAAVGTGFPFIFFMNSLFMGLGIGATIMISQYFGAGDMINVKKTVDTIYTSMMIISIPLSVIGVFASRFILELINVPADTIDTANIYMIIIFLGTIGGLGFNVNAGILQGLGDSRTSLIFLAIACVVNIILDLVFVIVFGWGVAGVAIATIIAQFCSWVFGIFYINKKYEFLNISPFRFQIDKELLKRTVKLGIPAGLQQALFSVGIMVFQSLVNRYGSDYMAGFNAANKIDTFAFMPIQSFATAATTYVGQNIGAGRIDRVKKGVVASLTMSFSVSVGICLLLIPLGPYLLKLFNGDPIVIESGMAYLYRILPFYGLLSLLFTINGIIRGAGEMIVPMIATLLSLWIVRVPSAYLFEHFFGRDNMYFGYAAGWEVGLTISGIYYLTGKWKSKAITGKTGQTVLLNE
ncbi:MAG: hypothetical protein K0S55_1197 [Clostridia bacterium]|nr:hypothetical protein [Clostridia bacterium]